MKYAGSRREGSRGRGGSLRAWVAAPNVSRRPRTTVALLAVFLFSAGCQQVVRQTDRDVARLIEARQRAVLGQSVPADVGHADPLPRPGPSAYERNPHPTATAVPEAFAVPATQPTVAPEVLPAVPPEAPPDQVFTLTRALAYAQRYRREYQTAKEELYLVALALTLERHLWTPIFAAELQTVYGNFGEAQDFDQAMRFVADMSVSQRLPYGGEFTAGAIATLIRDVKQTITAAEGSTLSLGLNIPFLRGAGHVARENLIQLERELTYAVREFERFRRRQLMLVAQAYFDLLRVKQQVIDSEESLKRAKWDLARAEHIEETRVGDPLDTMRAEQRKLAAENSLVRAREAFRAQADQFKLTIGRPVEEPLGMYDLEDIETIEREVAAGGYPLLRRPRAVDDEQQAINVALARRFDVLTAQDRIDDQRRQVEVSRNAMLPDLDWSSALKFDTDPNHYSIGAHHFDRANWQTEVVLSLPLERTAERNELRRALIQVRRAQRSAQEVAEQIRADVRSAVNQLLLQETTLRIQRRNLVVTERQAEFADIQFGDGKISNRDKIEAEAALLDAQNALNQAKTRRWVAILEFRLATETLRIDEEGQQRPDGDLVTP